MTVAVKAKQKCTYADYLQWSDDERWELIDGTAYNMSPAPRPRHQRIVMNMAGAMWRCLGPGMPCEVFPAPFDVRFPATGEAGDDETDTVVQPDISVICDRGKIDERGCVGPPDLVVEVLSEETGGRDEGTKFKLYEKHAVREYWIVNPWDETVRLYALNDEGRYQFPIFVARSQTVDSTVIKGLSVNLNDVFPTTDSN